VDLVGFGAKRVLGTGIGTSFCLRWPISRIQCKSSSYSEDKEGPDYDTGLQVSGSFYSRRLGNQAGGRPRTCMREVYGTIRRNETNNTTDMADLRTRGSGHCSHRAGLEHYPLRMPSRDLERTTEYVGGAQD
jgi:hypothetical protein